MDSFRTMQGAPSRREIAREQSCLLSALYAHNRGPKDPEWHCWACGVGPGPGCVYRAHIIPARFRGSLHPSNFLLLCCWCHAEQIDDAPITPASALVMTISPADGRPALISGKMSKEDAVAYARYILYSFGIAHSAPTG